MAPLNPGWRWNQARRHWCFYDRTSSQWVFYNPCNDHLVYEASRESEPRSINNIARPPPPPPITSYYFPDSTAQSAQGNYTWTPASTSSYQPDDTLASNVDNLSLNNRDPSTNQQAPTDVKAEPVRPEIYQDHGMRIVTAQNRGGVRTKFATSPANLITDPDLFANGVSAKRRLMGTTGESEALYPSYRLQSSGFFRLGRVFLILWSEPHGESGTVVTSYEAATRLTGQSTGEQWQRVLSKRRRFVVVREGDRYCTGVPIMTYGGFGVSKSGVNKSEHAKIYTGQEPPTLPGEEPRRGEAPMRPQSIRVDPDHPSIKLDPASRINFGKVHTIEHNLKVQSVGMVHPHSVEALQSLFANVVFGPNQGAPVGRAQTALPRGRGRISRSGPHVPASPATIQSSAARSGRNIRQSAQEPNLGEVQGADEVVSGSESDGSQEEDSDSDPDGQTPLSRRTMPHVQRRENIVAFLMPGGWTREQATNEADIALRVQDHFNQLRHQNYQPSQAIEHIAAEHQRSFGGTREAALSKIRQRLSYGTSQNSS